VAPRDAVEEAVAAIWAEVLGLDRVGIHDDFFDLGGHSLLGMQVIYRLRDTFRIEISVRHLFTATTIAGLAHALESLEPQPGQVKKIAVALKRIRGMSPQEVESALARREK
jgi:phthiocerol/phenolphthiocerol synthesis type-I polyketide synthase E